jgi:hypothetical protein
MAPRDSMRPRRDSGRTLLEVAVAVALTAVVIGGFGKAVTGSLDFTVGQVGTTELQEVGRRALDRIKADIQATGRFVDATLGVQLPHIYSNGQPSALVPAVFAHDQSYLTALAASFPQTAPASQPSNPPPFLAPGNELQCKGIREMVFRFPSDVDLDGRIVSSATGNVEWNASLVGYILIPNNQGTLNLVRRTLTGATIKDEVLCRCVEAMTIDTVDSKPILPMRAVEVHLHLLRRTSRGQIDRLHLTTTAGMRNS